MSEISMEVLETAMRDMRGKVDGLLQLGAKLDHLTPLIEAKLKEPEFPIPSSGGIARLAAALAKAQGEFTNPEKNKEVTVRPRARDNGTQPSAYTFSYSTLDAIMDVIRKPLSNNELALIQAPVRTQSGLLIRTVLIHSSGEWMSIDLPALVKGDGAQDQGSAITYARRYSISSMLGIVSDEDDDGNGNGADGNDVTNKQERGSSRSAPPATKPEPRPVSRQAPAPTGDAGFPPQSRRVAKYESAEDFATKMDKLLTDSKSGAEIRAVLRDNAEDMKKLYNINEPMWKTVTDRAAEVEALLVGGV